MLLLFFVVVVVVVVFVCLFVCLFVFVFLFLFCFVCFLFFCCFFFFSFLKNKKDDISFTFQIGIIWHGLFPVKNNKMIDFNYSQQIKV